MKERTVRVEVLFSPDEYGMLRDRMKEAGVRSMGPFMRKMALDGYVIKLDTTEIREVVTDDLLSDLEDAGIHPVIKDTYRIFDYPALKVLLDNCGAEHQKCK